MPLTASSTSGMETINATTYYNYFLPVQSSSSSSPSTSNSSTNNNTISMSASHILNMLISIYKSPLLKDDDYYFCGLQWVLYQFYIHNTQIKEILIQQHNITFGLDQKDTKATTGTSTTTTKTLAERKAEAQKRAMAAMSKQVQTFSKTFDMNVDDDDTTTTTNNNKSTTKTGITNDEDDKDEDEDDSNGNIETANKRLIDRTLEDQATECILCHEKSNNMIGYLSFTQYSNIISNSIILESSTSTLTSTSSSSSSIVVDNNSNNKIILPNLKKMYRVTAAKGCPVYNLCNESSHVMGHLNYGVHVYAMRRIGKCNYYILVLY